MNLILWLGAIVFGIDQITKLIFLKCLPLNRCVPVIDGFFNLTLIFNTGAAFGILINQGILLIAISVVTIVTLVVFGYFYASEKIALRIAIGMILGGAAGNLFDRIIRGYVVDFLDFYYKNYHWPAFNVADSSICVGTFLLLFYFLKSKESRQ